MGVLFSLRDKRRTLRRYSNCCLESRYFCGTAYVRGQAVEDRLDQGRVNSARLAFATARQPDCRTEGEVVGAPLDGLIPHGCPHGQQQMPLFEDSEESLSSNWRMRPFMGKMETKPC